MKVLKILLYTLVIIIAIPLVVALFVRKDYGVERRVVIHKPNAQVFDYIKHLKNQDLYSKWSTMDPNMKRSFRGTDGTVGFVSAWESPKPEVGKGEQEITKIVEGSRFETQLLFIKPFESQSDAYMTTAPLDSTSTEVKWGFKGTYAYPMNIMNLLMDMDAAIGGDFAFGLNRLKQNLEH